MPAIPQSVPMPLKPGAVAFGTSQAPSPALPAPVAPVAPVVPAPVAPVAPVAAVPSVAPVQLPTAVPKPDRDRQVRVDQGWCINVWSSAGWFLLRLKSSKDQPHIFGLRGVGWHCQDSNSHGIGVVLKGFPRRFEHQRQRLEESLLLGPRPSIKI